MLGLRRRAEADLAELDPAHARAAGCLCARGKCLDRAARPVRGARVHRAGRAGALAPVDSLLWGKTMSMYLAGNWRMDLWRAKLEAQLPAEVQRALWPTRADTPRPDAALPRSLGRRRSRQFPAPFTLPDTASNEWAVDGAHSASGAPLLAGDPHLAFGMPSIWYLARIDTPGGVLAGRDRAGRAVPGDRP